MVSITVVVQYPSGNSVRRELTVPDKTKVWELTRVLEEKLDTNISAEIAIGEEVLIGKTRLEQVKGNTTYTLTVIE